MLKKNKGLVILTSLMILLPMVIHALKRAKVKL